MKKLASVLGVAVLVGTLAGCTAFEPRNDPMTTDTFVGILFSGDSLTAVSSPPKVGETVHWNAGDKSYSEDGRYSAIYRSLQENASEVCYEDSESTGSVTVKTDPDDYSSHFDISTEACEDKISGFKVKWELDGGGRYDLKVSSEDGKDETKPYVDALQKYVDEKSAGEEASETPKPAEEEDGYKAPPAGIETLEQSE